MKILFMGSIPTFERTETREISDQEKPFARACEQMGYVAASRQHTILISDNHPSSVDYHVMNGVLRYIGEATDRVAQVLVNRVEGGEATDRVAQVLVNRVEGSELVFDRLSANVKVSYRFHPNIGHVLHGTLIPNLAALDSSDVLVMLGGRLTVRILGMLAADKERPVLSIPSFGGTSGEIYESLRYIYRGLLKDRFNDLCLLKCPWSDGFAEKAIDLAEALAQNKTEARPHSYFISYVWEDSEYADHVEVLLHRFRRAINRDESLIRAGVNLSDVVKSVINESDTFIALYNERFTKSLWCPAELAYALYRLTKGQKPRRVILLKLDETEPPIPYFGKLFQFGKDRTQRELSIRKIIEEENTTPAFNPC